MKRFSLLFLIFATAALINVRAETESIDLKALAKKARPAVMLLVGKQGVEALKKSLMHQTFTGER